MKNLYGASQKILNGHSVANENDYHLRLTPNFLILKDFPKRDI